MAKKIKPIIHLNPNQCPECKKGKLLLVEEESYVAPLDSKGLPLAGQTYIEQKLVCSKCGSEFDCTKKGMFFQVKYKDIKPIPDIAKDFNPFYE